MPLFILNKPLAPATKRIVEESRNLALAMGDPFVSSFHLVVASCKLNEFDSIKSIFFPDESSYQDFIGRNANGSPIEDKGQSLPLTVEAEEMLCQAAVEAHCYGMKHVQPFHLMLAYAAGKNYKDEAEGKEKSLYERVEKHFYSVGASHNKTPKRFWHSSLGRILLRYIFKVRFAGARG